MNTADAEFDGDDYQKWLADVARDCRCCSGCSDVPCGGCMQGAPCDDFACDCDCDDGRDSSWDDEETP